MKIAWGKVQVKSKEKYLKMVQRKSVARTQDQIFTLYKAQ